MLFYVLSFLAGVACCMAYPKVRNLIKPAADGGPGEERPKIKSDGGPGEERPPRR